MNALAGKTIRWKFADGPTFEHTFDADGGVTWTIVDGEGKGASRREEPCAALRVNDQTLAISYRSASGHTLTVILNLQDHKMIGFASSEKEWWALQGAFEFRSE